MKKVLASLLVLFVFMVSVPFSAEAQTRCYRVRRTTVSRSYYRTRTVRPYYATQRYSYYQRPSFYRRHRNAVNIAIGTGAGALLGGLLGGRRGVAFGALTGAGASALYTYKLNPKKRRY